MTRIAPLALVVLTLALAACGSDDDPTVDERPAPTGAPAGEGGPVDIGMRNLQFDPDDATVRVGQRVTWVNEDSVDHDVKAEEGADFASDTYGEGGRFSFTPTAAGTIEYVCTLHPGMDGKLTVER